jgi:hypothetical protein
MPPSADKKKPTDWWALHLLQNQSGTDGYAGPASYGERFGVEGDPPTDHRGDSGRPRWFRAGVTQAERARVARMIKPRIIGIRFCKFFTGFSLFVLFSFVIQLCRRGVNTL